MIAGAAEGHDEQHGPVSGKPVPVHVGEDAGHKIGQNTGVAVNELITGDQCDASVNQRGQVAQAQNLGTFDINVLCDQYQ